MKQTQFQKDIKETNTIFSLILINILGVLLFISLIFGFIYLVAEINFLFILLLIPIGYLMIYFTVKLN